MITQIPNSLLDFFAYGLSDDGGLEEFEESLPSRRSNSPTRSTSTATCARAASSSASLAATRAAEVSSTRAFSASSSATRARSHTSSPDPGTDASDTRHMTGDLPRRSSRHAVQHHHDADILNSTG